MLHTFIVIDPALYWAAMLALVTLIPTVAYSLGTSTQASVIGQRNYASILLRFRPCVHRLQIQIANLSLSASLESSWSRIVAEVEVNVL